MTDCPKLQGFTLLFTRLIVGAVFIYSGLAKLPLWSQPMEGMGAVMQNLTRFLTVVEPLGGVALIIGFLTFWAASGLTVIMLGSLYFVYFMFHMPLFTGYAGIGIDYNLLLLSGSAILAVFGAGKFSVDSLISAKKKKKK